jgi:hypothetical protein
LGRGNSFFLLFPFLRPPREKEFFQVEENFPTFQKLLSQNEKFKILEKLERRLSYFEIIH